MSEIITMTKFYSNREVAEILGLKPASIRVMKQRHADQLQGLWDNNNPDGETFWSQEGLEKLAEFSQTDEAKEFRSSALARRTQEAIAVDRAEISYQNEVQNTSTRTGHETAAYTINHGRYSGLEENLGDAIAKQKIANGAIKRIDAAVVSHLLRELNLGDDIDIGALLGN